MPRGGAAAAQPSVVAVSGDADDAAGAPAAAAAPLSCAAPDGTEVVISRAQLAASWTRVDDATAAGLWAAALAASADDSGRTLTVLAGSVLHAYPLFRRVLKDRPRVVRVPLVSGHVAVGLVVPKEKEELLVEELPPIPFDDDDDAYHDDCVVEGHQRWATQLDAALVSQRALQRSLPHYDDDEAAWQACWATLRQHDSQDLEPDEIAERQRREAKLRDFHAQISRRKRAEAAAAARTLSAAQAAAAAAAAAGVPSASPGASPPLASPSPAVAAASRLGGRLTAGATSPASAPPLSSTVPAGASAAAPFRPAVSTAHVGGARGGAVEAAPAAPAGREEPAAHAAKRPAADGLAAAAAAAAAASPGARSRANVCGATPRGRGGPRGGRVRHRFGGAT